MTKILFHSVILFVYGIYADIMKAIFEKKLKQLLLKTSTVSSHTLVYYSNKNYKIQSKIKKMQKTIEYELLLSTIKQY